MGGKHVDIYHFFSLLGEKCQAETRRHDHDCSQCVAQDFCYTAPASMSRDIIDGVIAKLEADIENG